MLRNVRLVIAALLCAVVWCAPSAADARDSRDVNARAVFRRLPVEFLENTMTGLTEDDKENLLDIGMAETWQLVAENADMLLMIPAEEGAPVTLRVFRGNGRGAGLVAAMCADTGQLCVADVWRLHAGREPVAMNMPPEPHILEFFRPGTLLPKDLTVNVTFCVDAAGLTARPLFWTSVGNADILPENVVAYVWDGGRFQKQVRPVEPELGAAAPNPAGGK